MPLPDLIIRQIYLEMESRHGGCVVAYSPYGIRVVVENSGEAAAGEFIVEMNLAQQTVATGLPAGEGVELHFAGTSPSGRYEAHADAANQVAELDEGNNGQTYLAPTPSPPPVCTSTPIATTVEAP